MGTDDTLAPLPPEDRHSPPASPASPWTTVTVEPSRPQFEMDWERALRTLQKQWRVAFAVALTVFVVVTIVSFRMKDIYEPKARLEIDPPGSEAFSLRDLLNSSANDQDYLQTQAQILQGNELAVATIRTLGLDRNAEIVDQKALAEAGSLSQESSPSSIQLTSLEHRALRAFKKRLSVEQVRNSRLVEVSFESHDPRLAAQVTNTTVNLFIDRNYRTRYEATMQASEWLQGQLTDLRQKVEKSNQALVEYQRVNGIVDVDDRQNTVTQKVGELNRQLTQAQADRIQLEAYAKMVEAGSADSLPQIRNNTLLQTLTQHFVDARGQLAQAQAIYGKNHTAVKKLQSQVDELEVQLAAERQRVISELKTSLEAARAREELMAEALNEMKGVVGAMNEKMIQFNVLKNEAQASAELYNALFARLKEAGISAGLKSSNIRLVDPARVLDRPTRPNRLLNIAFGLIIGILGGIGLAFLKENLDNTVRTPDEVKELTGLGSLAMFPIVSSLNGDARKLRGEKRRLLSTGDGEGTPTALIKRKFFVETPASPEAEAVRSLYTSIMLSRPGQPPRMLLVVSPAPGEGKTTVAINLAAVLAEHGRTCLVDADLRRPMVAKSLGLSADRGLTHVLTGSATLESVLVEISQVKNLFALPVGALPPNPGELISSDPMQKVLHLLRQQFEYIVLDTPPVLLFSDARALSPWTDGVVLVGRFATTTRKALVRSAELFNEAQGHVLGVVLNGVDIQSPDYYYYHYGYSSRYYKSGYEAYGDSSKKHRQEDDSI